MTTTHERRRPATGAGAGRAETTGTVDPETTAARAAEDFTACVLASRAPVALNVLDRLDLEAVARVDQPTGRVLTAAHALALHDVDPTPVLVLDELRRTGNLDDGHRGRLTARRLSAAATNYQPAERLRPLCAALAAELHRTRGVTAGEAIAAAYRSLSESDAYTTLCREGAAVRRAHDLVADLREGAGQ
ncbi:hypothetical protein ACWDPV_12025 [Gordonia sp. NPDC003504]